MKNLFAYFLLEILQKDFNYVKNGNIFMLVVDWGKL